MVIFVLIMAGVILVFGVLAVIEAVRGWWVRRGVRW